MVNRYVITMTLLALARVNFPACGEDAPREEWPVKPIGLQVADPVLTKVRGFSGGRWYAGTTTLLQCSPPEGFVIGWDEQRSSVSSYVDERGNNLAGEYRDGKLEGSSLRFLGCSEDRRHSFIRLWGNGIPDSSATSFRTSGKLLFIVAGQRRVHFRKNVPLKNGQEIVVGGQTIVIEEVPSSADKGRPLVLKFRPDHKIGEVRFFDTQDNEVAVWKKVYDVLNRQGQVILDKHARLANARMKHHSHKLEKASVEIIEWRDIGAVVVPFDVSVSVGLRLAEER